jgi:phosphoketolase
MVAAVGKADPRFVVTNADGNEASAMKNINEALGIRHPTTDGLYNQRPDGQVYEPLSEDACAGLAAGLALFGSRSLWLSYESFAINGWPIFQTVTQAMAELRRKTPSVTAMFTAGALEQGRNGWTHQRPEIENYVAAQMRNGNVYALFPTDANMIQAAYQWALESWNKGIAIFASKSPLPVRTTPEQAAEAVERGAVALYESAGGDKGTVVFAVTGDMVLLPVFEAKDLLESHGYRVRIVAVVNPRRLYRPHDVSWETCSQPDNAFMDDDHFDALFDGELLCAVSGGPGAPLEPVLLRARAPRRELMAWKRGETTATPGRSWPSTVSPPRTSPRASPRQWGEGKRCSPDGAKAQSGRARDPTQGSERAEPGEVRRSARGQSPRAGTPHFGATWDSAFAGRLSVSARVNVFPFDQIRTWPTQRSLSSTTTRPGRRPSTAVCC